MARYQVTVTSKSKESLTPLLRALEGKFPDLDSMVDSFDISESKRPIFGAGDPQVDKICIVWTIPKPNGASHEAMKEVVDYIKASGIGNVEALYDDEEDDNH